MALKDRILLELEEHRDQAISGQKLAEKFQVSRNAVWKAINVLKEEGHEIQSVRNLGYSLQKGGDVLTKEGILACLSEDEKNLPIYIFSEVDSTNNEARRMLASGFAGEALLVSSSQSSGRGRRGKSFYSPADSGVYLTMILQPDCTNEELPMVTLAAAVAVMRSIRTLLDIKVQLKWVNDLFYEGKKVGGILSEAVADLETGRLSDVIIGIGLNLHPFQLPEELSAIAGSLNGECTRNAMAASIYHHIKEIDLSNPDSYMKEYKEASLVLGHTILYHEEEVQAVSLDETGGLLIRHADGHTEILRGGEIKLLP